MSVRVVARIRPLLKSELVKDTIVQAASSGSEPSSNPTVVRIPNPKNAGEDFTFNFNSVYDQGASQQLIFDNEVSPTVKHLYSGFDVTLFAYGVTGTGKTYTMRGGKLLADRGLIPRLLSGIYRRGRKIEKDSQGETKVEVSMSYYEIYNVGGILDRVYDLFEAPEKRTPTGLQLRDNNGKTVVVGLTERPCTSLKEFEHLYDQANVNRSTSATKLNAHSSRSHAILCVKIAVTTGDETRISMASAIDLAGSEDNRRTDNDKERLVESASINKSLFVLAQCVEAISRKQQRIPYRESKMTRILSLGVNNGMTIMILNLAPVKSYHLDTLSSLNFANRTKKIEVKEIENEPIFKAPMRSIGSATGSSIQRQPLRPIAAVHNSTINNSIAPPKNGDKPAKAFSVYSDKARSRLSATPKQQHVAEPLKRGSDAFSTLGSRPTKQMRPSDPTRIARPQPSISKASIEEMVEKKVEEILAARALNEPTNPPVQDISEQVQKRLEMLEQRIENKEDARAEGLTYLLMAKQHHARGEEASALKMYQLALPYFPNNEKLAHKIVTLQDKMRQKREHKSPQPPETASVSATQPIQCSLTLKKTSDGLIDDDYREAPEPISDDEYAEDGDFQFKPKIRRAPRTKMRVFKDYNEEDMVSSRAPEAGTPRTQNLLRIINTRDLAQIKLLKGVGVKKAEGIVDCLCSLDDDQVEDNVITNLEQLGRLKGVGAKTVENMRSGLTA
ncbi:MAG: hypothetical protein M1827_001656 [Pycnora praestabilis]|nr:MAG: hypothetical protein M1827_001656 [Pycnora praestabilis]